MKTLPLILLVIVCAGCTSTWDLRDKYQGVIGAQYQTRSDCYIWKMARHEYDLEPFKLWGAEAVLGPAGTRLDFIPAGTTLKVLAAKRRFAGGDWDYLIAEIRAPRSGTRYLFEQLLGNSKFDPQEIDHIWKRLEPPSRTAEPASPSRGGSS